MSTIDIGRKEGAAVPLLQEMGSRLVQCDLGRGLLPYFILDPSNRLATVHERHRQTGQDRIDRQTGNSLIAQRELF